MVKAVNYEEVEDKVLMECISKGDKSALESLYARYSRQVYSLSIHMLRDPTAAEEVTQDTFFNVWRRAGSYKSNRGKVSSWLFSVAHNRTIDELRKRRREYNKVQYDVDLTNRPTESRADDPAEYASVQFEGARIKSALMTLRPEQRDVVTLAYFGGLTHSEISKELNQPLGTVKTRMRLAMKKLRKVLEPQIRESAEHGLQ